MNHPSIPITIGVTGHRSIRQEDVPVLYNAVLSIILELKQSYPNTEFHMLNSLAEGGDQICAKVALDAGIPIIAALPCSIEQYASDFTDSSLPLFKQFCHSAETLFIVPETEPRRSQSLSEKDYQYRQAGIYIAQHSHLLLALWDGDSSQKNGCGTSAAVSFSLESNFTSKSGIPVRSASNSFIYHIITPRDSISPAGTVHFIGDKDAFHSILSRTDEFNRLSKAYKLLPNHVLFDKTDISNDLMDLETLYHKSDSLSIRYANQYRRVLAFLALLGSILTLSFLLYDEAELYWMILPVGFAILLMFILSRFALHSSCHRRYLEYRALAEALRVQAYLRYAGSNTSAAELLSLTQKEETPWLVCALLALDSLHPVSTLKGSVRDIWVNKQILYHTEAVNKSIHKLSASDRIVRITLITSGILYIAALVFELFFSGSIFRLTKYATSPDLYRTVLKILLGGLSASTLFIANYYGKLSMKRSVDDHIKMKHFYEAVLKHIDRQGETEPLLVLLAREELAENGNWYTYQKENTPDISL